MVASASSDTISAAQISEQELLRPLHGRYCNYCSSILPDPIETEIGGRKVSVRICTGPCEGKGKHRS